MCSPAEMSSALLLSRSSRVLRALVRSVLPRRSSIVAAPRSPKIFGCLGVSSKMAGNVRQFATAPSSGGDSVARAPSSLAAENVQSGTGRFRLSPSSFLHIQKGDITVWSVDGSTDAIVNATNERMLGGGGVDGAIHRAAGPDLLAARRAIPEVRPGVRCPTGEARITPAFRLHVSHVIHTVGPIYDTDKHPKVSLRNAYRNSLRLAKENGIQYIAFPAISCGVYGYPYEEASKIAISAVKEFSDDFKETTFLQFLSFNGLFYKTTISTFPEGASSIFLTQWCISSCSQMIPITPGLKLHVNCSHRRRAKISPEVVLSLEM